ncbi:hypothetical protein MFUL124B02_17685 [Myxococcus fulvus 124B02]|nr:hypothetical protein MFUL124B02_17685 [Myxococcus fulvus 124B02]
MRKPRPTPPQLSLSLAPPQLDGLDGGARHETVRALARLLLEASGKAPLGVGRKAGDEPH